MLPPAETVVFDEATLAALHADRSVELRFIKGGQNHYYEVALGATRMLYQLAGPKFVGGTARYVGVRVA